MNKLKNNSKPLIWLMGLLLAGLVAGCGSGGNGGSGGTASAQPGTVSVSLTDAPACGYDEVNVTVSKVRVHQSGSADENSAGWTDIVLSSPRKINLLNLNDPTQANGALDYLGETSLPAGHYTQVRLVLVPNSGSPNPPFANSIVLEGQTQEIKLDTPSAVQSGIKLVNEFDVPSGQRVDLLLDFDACKSIVRTGNGKYKLKPVIKVIPYVLNGIDGFVDKALLGNNVVVSAQVNGKIVRATVPNANPDPNPNRGKFFLAHLPAGADVKYDVVITADGHATAVISGVPVQTDTSITTISTSAVPFTLQTSTPQSISGTVTLINPPPPPSVDDRDDGTVIVSAKQSLFGGPTVTVKTAVATVLDVAPPIGDYGYNMMLPIGAPSLAQYSAIPPPITPTTAAQSTVEKIYTVQGSAQVVTTTGTTVYATQNPAASPKDITVNPTQDFTLTP
jgi:hypothetical protein